MNPVLRPARSEDLAAVRDLLAAASLPLEGFGQSASIWAATVQGKVVGAVAFERHAGLGLLRSLVVAPQQRGRGLGKRLLVRAMRAMHAVGIRDAYALTTTIAPWLAREGWTPLARQALPTPLLASPELQGACPDTAQAFHMALGPGRPRPPSGA